jgi:chemotaxis methyl-accepting protein methylase
VSASPSDHALDGAIRGISRSKAMRVYLGRPYIRANTWIWSRLPASWRSRPSLRPYGSHVHRLIQLRGRNQATGTFFFRNRPELELLTRLLDQFPSGSTIRIAILGCSKGAEVYSFCYTIRTKRPDLDLHICAVDISREVVEIGKAGVYRLDGMEPSADVGLRSIFERMSPFEMEDLFEQDGENAGVKRRFRETITWHLGDAGDPSLIGDLGLQDIVVANRFLCHMNPEAAEACLRNLARLVKKDGYLFVSGVDLAVRSKVAAERRWRPVTDLIEEIHEGDPTLRRDWPLCYWGLEPLNRTRADWTVRYASVFRLPGAPISAERFILGSETCDQERAGRNLAPADPGEVRRSPS